MTKKYVFDLEEACLIRDALSDVAVKLRRAVKPLGADEIKYKGIPPLHKRLRRVEALLEQFKTDTHNWK